MGDLDLAKLNPFAKEFFHGYLVDHFLFKFKILESLVNGDRSARDSLMEGLEDVDDGKLVSSLRLEIRATVYQAIETLFELIFSLEPKDGRIENRHLWYFLSDSKKRGGYDRIAAIATGETTFLDRLVEIGNGNERPFWRYIFFFNQANPETESAITASGPAIKDLLILFAKEFEVREEYNAYKHGLRIMPIFNKILWQDNSSGATVLKSDLSQHMTYLTQEEDTIIVHSIPLDSRRDIRLGFHCWSLIGNIIETRRAYFEKGYKGTMRTFSPDAIGSIGAWEVDTRKVVFRFTIEREPC